ncbi:12221_t:CDS:2, partial [Funneliformis geosporum]
HTKLLNSSTIETGTELLQVVFEIPPVIMGHSGTWSRTLLEI